MDKEKVSILSTFVNFGLATSKLFFGLMIGSAALIADGTHSGIDIVSSFGTYLGIKVAKKPVDEKHPYGHYRAESLAGLFVTIFLASSALWIIYEAVVKFFTKSQETFSPGAIILVIITIIVNEGMARLKFYYGRKDESLSLVADAEHSRADVLSSAGVLIPLLFAKYFPPIDGIVAFLIGGYILYESFVLGREITDSLLDVSDKSAEERIRKICQSHKIEISDLKTRKIGSATFAEIKIKLPSKLKVEDVQKITDILEERLLNNISELKQVVISIEAYQMARSVILPKFGKKIGELESFEKIGPEKKGKRIIIPFKNNSINDELGSERYLVIDVDKNKINFKKIFTNPYFGKGSPHGARFAKAIRADKIFVRQIGENAKKSLENFGIEVETIPLKENIDDILEKIKKENDRKN
ncbi:MAG TPA: cation diffusion facilitator family transporter [Candidatus Portnoybacteria bacterium]|nr:cation diffusion facilitator family transporter [Candidatus Portnoybacteria bacterium]